METSELQPSKNKILTKWIVASCIGATIGMIIFVAMGFYAFAHGGEAPLPPREYLSDEEIFRQTTGNVILYSFITFFSVLPYGFSQWLVLRNEFKVSVLWIFSYSLGVVPFIAILIAGVDLVADGKLTASAWWIFMLAWLVSNTITGGLQAILLRKRIRKAYLLIPINLLAAIALGVSVAIGFAVNLVVYCIGAIFGGALAGITHSGILGLFLTKSRNQVIKQ